MKTFHSPLPSMRFNSEWKKTFINKYNVSKTDASSIKAVQEMWIRCLEKPRSSSICLWTGVCSRANRLMQSYWFERSTPGRGKVWRKESWRSVLGITKFFVWCKVSLCITTSIDPNPYISNLWGLPEVDYHRITNFNPQQGYL